MNKHAHYHACTRSQYIHINTYLYNTSWGTKQLKEKPNVIADCNQFMLGVDKMDQLITYMYYSFLHKSVKWWRKVFFWALEVVTVNSYISYKEQETARGVHPMAHLAFRHQLNEVLSKPMKCTAICQVHPGPMLPSQSLEQLQPITHFLRKSPKRKDCVVCSKRQEGGMRRTTPYQCKTCSDNPALCPFLCFEAYHTNKSYSDV